MRRLLGLALRNLLRNKWRSAVSVVALLFGVCAMVFLQGFVGGFIKGVIEDAVLARVGAIQVHRAGYLEAEKDHLSLDLPDDPSLVARMLAVPGVRAATRRLDLEGMLSNGTVSVMIVATAIDPATEYGVCPRRRDLVADGSTPLAPGGRSGILLGSPLAEGLGARPGAALLVSSTTRSGAANALDVTVHGLLPDNLSMESRRGVVVPLALAQSLLRMEGRVTEYVLHVDDLEGVDLVAAELRRRLGPGHEVTTWRDLHELRDSAGRMSMVMVLVGLILALLVVSGIVNTVLMSVHERVREIGTMLAVGVRRRQVLLVFLVEAAMLGLVGSSLGAGLGLALIRLWSDGIRFPVTAVSRPLVVVPQVGPWFIAGAIAVAVLVAMLAALYPSWKASRLRPVDALRSG